MKQMKQIKQKRFVIGLLLVILFANKSLCTERDAREKRFSVGVTGGIAQSNSFSGDLYGALRFKKNDLNFGYLNFGNKTSYKGVSDLQFKSHGLFVEGNHYLIGGLYTGLRFSVNFNWINKESHKLFDNNPNLDSPTFFSGIAGYGQIGYCHPIGNTFSIKIQTQIGLHNYKISQGWFLIDNSNDDFRNERLGIERHAEILYNLSIGLLFKF